ncbi:C6 transcription factor [Aspergillus luchuensis]|uniref:C6 transcription factor n=1 Tax=Aspergillus kawachii TaxID=1069201 RepID=A0A146FB10_ASPKA|nr:C6 transcription factor [Aspergillus luchuensis]
MFPLQDKSASFQLMDSPKLSGDELMRLCKTCSDYNHICQGYSEPSTHARSQSDAASRTPTIAPLPPPSDATALRAARKAASRSPSSPRRTIVPITGGADKPSEALRLLEPKEEPLPTDTSSRTTKELEQQNNGASPESKSLSPLRSPKFADAGMNNVSTLPDTRDTRDYNNIPFYDRDDSLSVSNLVMHLCDLFFVHLGCSFPFLQRDRFLRDLKDKRVDTMLVDAVCALSARFSPHPLLSPPQAPTIDGSEPQIDLKKSTRGQPFAHRAMSALVDTLSCPTLSGVQACLLLAYDEFGSNHDSGLWMYLGISIRMAQDLGMQKVQGLEYNYGLSGVTPNAVMTGQAGKLRDDQYDEPQISPGSARDMQDSESRRARERERVDSFWSIFFLDRVISSGTGRPVTLRDEDIELCFPLQSESRLANGWPAPFPPLIRIIHLYGRVTDLINGIQDVNHVTSDTLKMLAGMESDLTGIYQRLSPRLHFNAANFQAYVKAKEGTNFILLHFPLLANQSSGFVMPNMDSSSGTDRKPTAKHILLASAAKENYQRCYKALKALETYWEGTKYILTVLDQKAKGIVDPLLYTTEEMESAVEVSAVPPFTAPPWRRTQPSLPASGEGERPADVHTPSDGARSPKIDPSQAIGWALTGATNSSQPNLSLLYQLPAQAEPVSDKPTYSSQYSHSYPHLPVQSGDNQNPNSYPQPLEPSRNRGTTTSTSMAPGPERFSPLASSGQVTTSDANLLLGLNTSFPSPASRPPNTRPAYNHPSSRFESEAPSFNYSLPAGSDQQPGDGQMNARTVLPPAVGSHAGDIFIQSQDIDMATLQQQDQLPFTFTGEILPWLEYLPQDVLNYFGEHQNYPALMSPHDETPQAPH